MFKTKMYSETDIFTSTCKNNINTQQKRKKKKYNSIKMENFVSNRMATNDVFGLCKSELAKLKEGFQLAYGGNRSDDRLQLEA